MSAALTLIRRGVGIPHGRGAPGAKHTMRPFVFRVWRAVKTQTQLRQPGVTPRILRKKPSREPTMS